jgi:hypothetical protein
VLGSNPQRWDARDAQWRTRLARWRATSAPVISAGGRVSVLGDNVDFGPEDWVFSLQAASTLPDIPSWAAVIGQGYWLHASPGAPDLRRTMINFVYDGRQVSPDQESLLRIYFRRDGVWTPLPTQVNYEQNFAAAPTQGPGLYALILAVEVPLQGPGWNIFAYTIAGEGKAVADALKTITGLFTAVYAYEPTDADPWRVFDPAAPAWVNDLTRLEYGKSYLIYATESTTLHPAGGTGPGAEDGPNNAQATALAPPAVLYGTIPATGTEAYAAAEAAGQIIAWIDGRNCGAAQTAQIDNTTVYAIEVASEVNVSGCGAPGQTVRLTLDGKDTGTTAAWDNTRATQVIAGQGGGKGLYLPYIER